jgi:hypothetical protein
MGLIFSVLGSVACLAAGLWNAHVGDLKIYSWVCLAANLMFLAWWIFIIKPAWVSVPAFAYAERLLESIENIPQSRRTSAEKSGP